MSSPVGEQLSGSSSVAFPSYFIEGKPDLVIDIPYDMPVNGFQAEHIRLLRRFMGQVIGEAAVQGALREPIGDTAEWLVTEIASEGSTNAIQQGRLLLGAGFGVTRDGESVEYFIDSEAGWNKDSNRRDHGRGIKILVEAGVKAYVTVHPDGAGKTLYFVTDPATPEPESQFELDLSDFDIEESSQSHAA